MNPITYIQNWVNTHSQRDRLFLFFGGFIFIYLIYFIMFSHPLSKEKSELKQKIVELNTQYKALKSQNDIIKEALQTPVFLQMLMTQKKINAQLTTMQQQIEKYKGDLFSPDAIPDLTNKILAEKRNNSVLVSLEEYQAAPWPAQELKEKTTIYNAIPTGYQHGVQITFQNDYFGTINYLYDLERLSRYVYWDSLEYKVTNYPKAMIVVKFHVLSIQKS